MWQLFLYLYYVLATVESCVERKAEFGKICVCNSTYCDAVPNIGNIASGSIKVYLTSNQSPGFNVRNEKFGTSKQAGVLTLTVNTNVKFQKILGFGGAFTGSTGYNIKQLPEAAQRKLLESLFGENGIEFSMSRVPIGSTDFSLSSYTLDDHADDMDLKYFALHSEDLNYKVYICRLIFLICFEYFCCYIIVKN